MHMGIHQPRRQVQARHVKILPARIAADADDLTAADGNIRIFPGFQEHVEHVPPLQDKVGLLPSCRYVNLFFQTACAPKIHMCLPLAPQLK